MLGQAYIGLVWSVVLMVSVQAAPVVVGHLAIKNEPLISSSLASGYPDANALLGPHLHDTSAFADTAETRRSHAAADQQASVPKARRRKRACLVKSLDGKMVKEVTHPPLPTKSWSMDYEPTMVPLDGSV